MSVESVQVKVEVVEEDEWENGAEEPYQAPDDSWSEAGTSATPHTVKQELTIEAPENECSENRTDSPIYRFHEHNIKVEVELEPVQVKREIVEDDGGGETWPSLYSARVVKGEEELCPEQEDQSYEVTVEGSSTSGEGNRRKHALSTCSVRLPRVPIDPQRDTLPRESAALARQRCVEEETNFCDICQKQYLNRASYNKHMRIHRDKPYICDVCDKHFLRRDGLISHYRVHTGEKPFVCDICNKQFAGKPNLTNHRRIHTGEKPYACNYCAKTFAQKINLVNHERIHTGEKPYKCDVCNKQFAQNSDLNNHKRTHTGDKPYSCEVCEKQFARKTDCTKHYRIHTGERPYACELCGRRFVQKSHVITHMRKQHGVGARDVTEEVLSEPKPKPEILNRDVTEVVLSEAEIGDFK